MPSWLSKSQTKQRCTAASLAKRFQSPTLSYQICLSLGRCGTFLSPLLHRMPRGCYLLHRMQSTDCWSLTAGLIGVSQAPARDGRFLRASPIFSRNDSGDILESPPFLSLLILRLL